MKQSIPALLRAVICCHVLLCAHLLTASEVPFEATDLDGNSYFGELTALDGETLLLRGEDGEQRIDRDRLDSLQSLLKNPFDATAGPTREPIPGLGGRPQSALPRPVPKRIAMSIRQRQETEAKADEVKIVFPEHAALVELLDGSRLIVASLVSKDQSATCRLPGNGEISVPFREIASIRFEIVRPDDGAAPPEGWRKLATSTERKGDRLVVGRADALDAYEGIIQEIGPETVSFIVDGETLPVPRRRAFGLLFHVSPDSRARTGAAPAWGRLVLWDGSQIVLQSLEYREDTKSLQWTSPSGVSGSVALREVDQLRIGRKDVVYLSEQTPATLLQTLPFDWEKREPGAEESSGLRQWQAFRANRMRPGKQPADDAVMPEAVAAPTDTRLSKVVNKPIPGLDGVLLDGVSYDHGLAIPPGTTLVYAIPEAFAALRGIVGVDDRLRPGGRSRLTIQADDQLLGVLDFRGDEAGQTLKYDLPPGARTLKITVDFPPDSMESIPLSFGDPRLIP